MELTEMIRRQETFDAARVTTFNWSQPFTEQDSRVLTHNVIALAGEVGELADLVKKYDRGDFEFSVLMERMPGELADILIYLLKLSYQGSVDLEEAFLRKMVQNSERFPVAAEVVDQHRGGNPRFRPADLARRGDPAEILVGIETATARLRRSLSAKDLSQLYAAFTIVGIAPPRDPSAAVAVGLASLVYARAFDLIGQPQRRSALWDALEPVASKHGVDRQQLAALTGEEHHFEALLLEDRS